MHRMKQQDTRLQRGRPVAWSFGAEPTSSPASSTPRCAASGLDLGPAPKAGIHAVDTSLCPLPGSGDRWDAWMRVRAIGQRKTGSRALPLKPHQGALPLGTPPRAEPLEPITWLDAGTGGKAPTFLGSRLPWMRRVRRLRWTRLRRQNRSVAYFRVSRVGVAPVGSNQPVSSLRSILPSFGALPDPAERPRTSVKNTQPGFWHRHRSRFG